MKTLVFITFSFVFTTLSQPMMAGDEINNGDSQGISRVLYVPKSDGFKEIKGKIGHETFTFIDTGEQFVEVGPYDFIGPGNIVFFGQRKGQAPAIFSYSLMSGQTKRLFEADGNTDVKKVRLATFSTSHVWAVPQNSNLQLLWGEESGTLEVVDEIQTTEGSTNQLNYRHPFVFWTLTKDASKRGLDPAPTHKLKTYHLGLGSFPETTIELCTSESYVASHPFVMASSPTDAGCTMVQQNMRTGQFTAWNAQDFGLPMAIARRQGLVATYMEAKNMTYIVDIQTQLVKSRFAGKFVGFQRQDDDLSLWVLDKNQLWRHKLGTSSSTLVDSYETVPEQIIWETHRRYLAVTTARENGFLDIDVIKTSDLSIFQNQIPCRSGAKQEVSRQQTTLLVHDCGQLDISPYKINLPDLTSPLDLGGPIESFVPGAYFE